MRFLLYVNIIGMLENARGNSLQLEGLLAHRREMRLDLFCLFLSDEDRSRNMKKQLHFLHNKPCSSSRGLRLHDVFGFYPIKSFVIKIQLEKDRSTAFFVCSALYLPLVSRCKERHL